MWMFWRIFTYWKRMQRMHSLLLERPKNSKITWKFKTVRYIYIYTYMHTYLIFSPCIVYYCLVFVIKAHIVHSYISLYSNMYIYIHTRDLLRNLVGLIKWWSTQCGKCWIFSVTGAYSYNNSFLCKFIQFYWTNP